jgi:predicted nucleic acid-binding Zn ribbon protein
MKRRGPRPVAGAVEALAARMAPATPLAEVQRVWPAAVGAAVAAEAAPVSERGGTVTVACSSSVWAQELDLMAPELVGRINEAIGRATVAGLRCVATGAPSPDPPS